MGLFNSWRRKPEVKRSGGVIRNSFDITSPNRISRTDATSQNKGWLYGITNLVGNNVAEQTLRLLVKTEQGQKKVANFNTSPVTDFKSAFYDFGKASVEELTDHPAQELLRNANNYTDGFNLIYQTQLSMDLVGDAYWYVVKEDNVPVEIHLLDPTRVTVVPNKTQSGILGYIYNNTSATNVSFYPEEIVRFSMSSSYSRWYGMSPAIAQSGILGILEQGEKLEYSLLKNAGIPPLILKYAGHIDKNKIRELELEWKRSTTGSANGNVKVIDAQFDVDNVSNNLEELMHEKSKIISIKALAFAYGVPFSMVDTSDQKKAGLDQLLKMLAVNCVQPRLARIQQCLNQQYLPMWDVSGDMRFIYDDPAPDSAKDLAAILNGYVASGVMLVNEARAELGLPEIAESEMKPKEKEANNEE